MGEVQVFPDTGQTFSGEVIKINLYFGRKLDNMKYFLWRDCNLKWLN